ncbi:nonsense-mediated mRNA decay factor SMG7 [Cornus florida]|uniref:nonsense-mediated mRNA decay factor SMG7 n=1 Tax=Cornus florida TaxID=4283 RepID=UPI00289B4A86|nr:nonsense-mediated mRNA decay factor SMG7 [Cornus florida]
MMIVQMDKMSAPSSWELAQRFYEKNVELENRRRRSAQARVPSDPNAWQQMRENYEAIILEDHTFSEQHNIEYALWQLHYRRIEEFRAHLSAALASAGSTTSQGGKGPVRPDRITKIRLQFKTFLSEATGFYHDLILKIRAKYGLPLGYFSEDSGNQIVLEKDGKRSAETKKGLVSCHRCLIYLGDLARYKGLYGEGDSKSRDYAAASSYYLQAACLWPSSGNPHHQLAILATYSGDEFVAVYRYFRSLAVENPFSTARDNLIVAFEKNRQSYSQLHGDAKASATNGSSGRTTAKGRGKSEAKLRPKDANIDSRLVGEKAVSNHEIYKVFCVRFVRLNGILFTRTSLETFAEVLLLVSSALHELLSSGPEEELNFGTDPAENGLTIVKLISILIFTVHNVNREAEGQTYADIVQRTVLLQNALAAVFELLGQILRRCIQLRDSSSSCLLPGIMVFLEWLACCPDVAAGGDTDDKQATVRSKFWNDCISFLNKLLSNGLVSIDDEDETCFFNMSRYEEGETENRLALWEDFELRGFVPLQPAQTILDFSRKHSSGGEGKKEQSARVKRILAAGKALANVVRVDQKTLFFDLKLKKFVIGVEPQTSDDFMLTSFSGSPESVSRIQDFPTDPMMNSGAVQPKVQLYMEGEDEDEEIVFKPTVTEKRSDVIASKLTHYKGPEPVQDAFAGDSQFFGGSMLTSHSNLCHQSAFCANSQQSLCSASVANIVPQHLQPIHSHSSMWFLDQQTSLANESKDFTISENGYSMKPGIQEDLGISQAHSLSLLPQQSANIYANDSSCIQGKASETVIQSNFDFIASSGVDLGSLAAKTSSALPANSRKSAVTRPVRHRGPPPGFSHVPPKQVSESFSVTDLTGENPLMDDYSWLDGYELSSSMKGLGLNQSIHQPSRSSPQYISEGNGSVETITFPFPGKLVPTVQFPVEKQQGWQDHKPLEHLNPHHDQLQEQHIMKGSQQFIPPEKYQGQSIWAGRYFV